MPHPGGTVTFLFTDIEGSTKLWEQYPEVMRVALARHDALLQKAIEDNNGYVFKTVGDAFCAAFPTAPDALNAALASHLLLGNEEWDGIGGLRVRMGLHTGEAEERDGDYFGPTLNRVARLQALAYGGQTLLSQATYELVRDHLPDRVETRPLGLHRLKDLNRAEQVHQVCHPNLPSEFPLLRSLNNLPNNLPLQLTSFIGREPDMEEVKRLTTSHSFVTLLGPGGTGKTRLSLQVGADLLDQYPDGVWFVELASLADPSLVAQQIAVLFGVKEEVGRSLTQTLSEYLKARSLLLILDNCEHLIDACARIVDSLLRLCPHVHILASSRERLNISGETVYHVPSLKLPDPKSFPTLEDLTQFEAVRLFIERAISIQPSFSVTNQNAPALAQLCQRLDGIPLAIELAAARARSLSVQEINNKLDNCFRLLTGGSRTALPRQQTLRALIDWSYDLLSEAEKQLLSRLSVFAGGWILEAAEEICVGEDVEAWEMLDLLTNLHDKSLLGTSQKEGETRYRLLETIRQYAHDRLEERGEADVVGQRHHIYYLRLVEEISQHLSGSAEQSSFERLETEHENLRAGLVYALAKQMPDALSMASALGKFWYLGGYLREGREFLERSLAGSPTGGESKVQATVCFHIGRLAVDQGDIPDARTFLEKSLRIFRQLDDKRNIAAALDKLGIIALRQDDTITARELLEESLALRREVGDQSGIAAILGNLGILMQNQGDYAAAQSLTEESLALQKTLGNQRGIATAYTNLGNTLYHLGELARARQMLQQSLKIAQELHDDWYRSYPLCGLAIIAKAEREYEEARFLAEESLAIVKRIGDQHVVATCLRILGDVACLERDFSQAQTFYHENLLLSQELEWKPDCVGLLEVLAYLALDKTQLLQQSEPVVEIARYAAILLGSVEAQRIVLNIPLPALERKDYEQRVEHLHSIFDEQALNAMWTEGQALSLEKAISYALTHVF